MPDYEKHQREIRALKQDLAALILEQQELEFHGRESIEAEYMAKIGSLEHKVFELQCKAKRLRRKHELIARAVDALELVELSGIDAQLITEFSADNERLSESAGRLDAALRRHNPMSGDEEAELRRLYALLLGKLHPELQPLQDEATKALYSGAVDAYRNAALDRLRDLCAATEGRKAFMDAPAGSMDRLLKTKAALRDRLDSLGKHIGELKNSYPWNKKDLLDDETELRETAAGLSDRIAELRGICEDLEKRVAGLLGRSAWIA
jgi:hypothetical protein